MSNKLLEKRALQDYLSGQMRIREEFRQINAQFKRIGRGEREQILCAMIRVNYGTPWTGDLDRLKGFLPASFHAQLNFSGLAELIDALSPFADEPTEVGFPDDEITLNDATSLLTQAEATATITQFGSENTATIKIPA